MDSKWEGDHATRKFGPAVFRAELTMKPSDYLTRNCWFAAASARSLRAWIRSITASA